METEEIFDNPVTQQLSQQVERILGIKVTNTALEKLHDHLNRTLGASFFEKPGAYQHIFASSEVTFDLARLLTVNETYFFREPAHFNLLLRNLLPALSTRGRPVRICSAATSIGCEAYSIAMVVDYYNRTTAPISSILDAFDINKEVIKTAREGRYNRNAFRDDGSQWQNLLDRYVFPTGNTLMVHPSLPKKVHFYPYNIMDGLPPESYDLIFFRNAFIYFAPESRMRVLDILVNALIPGGVLVMGISETAAVDHPLLGNCFHEDAFYFQKKSASLPERVTLPRVIKQTPAPAVQSRKKPEPLPRKTGLTIESKRIAEIIADEHNAVLITEKILALLPSKLPREKSAVIAAMGNELIIAVISLINREDFSQADAVLSLIEQYDTSAYTNFLRGEYFYHKNRPQDAEYYYNASIKQDNAFWPAFYRVTSLTAKENHVRYAYNLKQALESIEQGKHQCYEACIGGFSPDYYRQALEKQVRR
ncbi:MAG: chemotaxis protein CheR [Treponema sp.]|nr:chemotaxis protein CheR [Treponema sp.]